MKKYVLTTVSILAISIAQAMGQSATMPTPLPHGAQFGGSGGPTIINNNGNLQSSSSFFAPAFTGDGSGLTALPSGGNAVPLPLSTYSKLTVYVTSFGAIADGTSHPLSAKYSTLVAAQNVCADATSLTQEQDWCAYDAAKNYIHSLANSALGIGLTGGSIYFPATGHAYYMGSSPIVLNNASLDIHGDKQWQTELEFTGGVDGIDYGLNNTITTSGALSIHDMSFYQSGQGGVCIRSQTSNTHPTLDISNIKCEGVGGVESGLGWGFPGVIAISPSDAQISRSTFRGYTQQGAGDFVTTAETTNSLTFASLPANLWPGETVYDLTNPLDIPPGCVVASPVTSTSFNVNCPAGGTLTVSTGDDISIRAGGVEIYGVQQLPGHFWINILNNYFINMPTYAVVANAEPCTGTGKCQGIQGLNVQYNNFIESEGALWFANQTGTKMPQIWFEHNQVQTPGTMERCENCESSIGASNLFLVGGTTGPHPYVPTSAFMYDWVGGNFDNLGTNDDVVTIVNSPLIFAFARSDSNHTQWGNPIVGFGDIAPIKTMFQLTGAANNTSIAGIPYTSSTLTTNGNCSIGGNTISFGNIPVQGRYFINGDSIIDTTNPSAIPQGTTIVSAASNVATISNTCVSPGVSSGDTIVVTSPQISQNIIWETTWGGISTTGGNQIYMENYFLNSAVAVGETVFDLTNPSAIPAGCTISTLGTSSAIADIGLSCTLTGTVALGDTIKFVIPYVPLTPEINSKTPETFTHVTAPTYFVFDGFNDCYLSVQHGSAVNIYPPPFPRVGFKCTITDFGGLANLYPITWLGTMNDGTTPTVNQPYGTLTLEWNGTTWDRLTPIYGAYAPLSNCQTLTASSGTFVAATWATEVEFCETGGGGGGGGVTATNGAAAASGGPGVFECAKAPIVPGQNINYVIGAGGTGGGVGGGNGSNGGITTFLGITTTGGLGGSGSSSGVASGANINSAMYANGVNGYFPSPGNAYPTSVWNGPSLTGLVTTGQVGANSPWGTGGAAGAGVNAGNATGYGAGGGAPASTGSSATGGNGAPGAIRVCE